ESLQYLHDLSIFYTLQHISTALNVARILKK
ncbi:unnamed protein product, partial [marine sediment metagenome]